MLFFLWEFNDNWCFLLYYNFFKFPSVTKWILRAEWIISQFLYNLYHYSQSFPWYSWNRDRIPTSVMHFVFLWKNPLTLVWIEAPGFLWYEVCPSFYWYSLWLKLLDYWIYFFFLHWQPVYAEWSLDASVARGPEPDPFYKYPDEDGWIAEGGYFRAFPGGHSCRGILHPSPFDKTIWEQQMSYANVHTIQWFYTIPYSLNHCSIQSDDCHYV